MGNNLIEKLTMALFIGLGILISIPAQAERLLATKGNIEVIVENEENWCKKSVNFTFRSPDPSVFLGDRLELQKIIGGLRAIMGIECPKADYFIINAKSNNKMIFHGQASSENNWSLVLYSIEEHFDQLTTQFIEHYYARNFAEALTAIQTARGLDLPIPENFLYFEGRAFIALGKRFEAKKTLEEYRKRAGPKGKYYLKSGKIINQQ